MYKSLKRLEEENYTALAEAIILQAVKDYRDVLYKLNHDDDCRILITEKRRLERFFRSGWFTVLTSIDGKALAERLRKEAKGK